MGDRRFTVEHEEQVEILTITRPEVLNALNFQLLSDLKETFLEKRKPNFKGK
jgi:enoyl-CoA hydratase/carnithine racemase